MKSKEPTMTAIGLLPPGDAEPDVWWGEQGIDAPVCADPIPYDVPAPARAVESQSSPLAAAVQ